MIFDLDRMHDEQAVKETNNRILPYLRKEYCLYQVLKHFYAVHKARNLYINWNNSFYSDKVFTTGTLCWMPKLEEDFRRLTFEEFIGLLDDFKKLYKGGRIIEGGN